MKGLVAKSYGWLHSALVEGVRRLPVSSKTIGPPKGIVSDVRSWVRDYKTVHLESECWYQEIDSAAEVQYPPAQALAELPPIFVADRYVHQPEVCLALIPKARLLSRSGIIISPDDRVFEQSC